MRIQQKLDENGTQIERVEQGKYKQELRLSTSAGETLNIFVLFWILEIRFFLSMINLFSCSFVHMFWWCMCICNF